VEEQAANIKRLGCVIHAMFYCGCISKILKWDLGIDGLYIMINAKDAGQQKQGIVQKVYAGIVTLKYFVLIN